MPKAKDGKEFPYTKEGLTAMAKYNDKIGKNNKTMGNKNKGKKAYA